MSDVDTLDERDERHQQLEQFARAGDRSASREVVIPQQMFGTGADRIVGAQEVAVYRDETRVLAKLKALAAAAGEDWYYRFPVKNRKENRTDWIEGPSIKLANDLARLYGNCDVDVRVGDQGDNWLFYARFTDYETGFSLTRPFQQRKNASKMGGDDARRLDIAFQIGVSKAERNVIVNALQTHADFAFNEARQAIVDKVGKNLGNYREKVLQRLAEEGIDKGRVERAVGRVAAEWLAPDIARIIATIKAIGDGMATWEESFPTAEAAAATEGEKPAEDRPALDKFADDGKAAAAAAKTEKAEPKKAAPKAKAAAPAEKPVEKPAEADAPAEDETDSEAAAAPADAPEAAVDTPNTTAAAEGAPAAALTQAEKTLLKRYALHLEGALQEKTLARGSAAFLDDHAAAEHVRNVAKAIYDLNAKRINGEIAISEVDNAVRALVA